MTQSMTGFATRRGTLGPHAWVWDLRSVNGKGLDLRLRVPDWIEGLETALRAELSRALARGNVSLTLKLTRDETIGGLRLNLPALRGALAALVQIEDEAMAAGITLGQASQADVLLLRGVVETGAVEDDPAPLRAALLADLPALIADFTANRAAEGAALAATLTAQIDRIEALRRDAAQAAIARRDAMSATLRENVARVLTEGVDETRIAQELALLAVKADVTEELDRIAAHVTAARALLADPAPVGRKFDFLMQEFMREANTLCSKSGAATLTAIGLDLKVAVDQMREQVANIE